MRLNRSDATSWKSPDRVPRIERSSSGESALGERERQLILDRRLVVGHESAQDPGLMLVAGMSWVEAGSRIRSVVDRKERHPPLVVRVNGGRVP